MTNPLHPPLARRISPPPNEEASERESIEQKGNYVEEGGESVVKENLN